MHIEKMTNQIGHTLLETFFNAPLVKLISAGIAVIVGLISNGHEAVLTLILTVYLLDFITGVAKAIKSQDFHSGKFFKGAIKLLVYGIFLLIGAGMDIIFYTGAVFTNFFFAYIFVTDAISILENLEELGFTVPIFFVKYLEIRRKKMVDAFISNLSDEERQIVLRAEKIKECNNFSKDLSKCTLVNSQ